MPTYGQSGGAWLRKLAWLVVPLVILGEIGHQLLGRLGQVLAHHFFHIAFGLAGLLFFGTYVFLDIRRHGWPSFSWRIRPGTGPQSAPRA